jgi:hypothetical protein
LTVQSVCGASSTDLTTASILQFCGNAFTAGGNKSLRLDSGKPTWCIQVEPMGNCYINANVVLSSITMLYSGGTVSEIPAISDKTSLTADKNQDGIEEITVCFRKEDLRELFSALPAGENTVIVTIRMDLVTGGQVFAELFARVFTSGGVLAASVSPNPFNPSAVLTFRTTRPGPARVVLYNVSGRAVRTLLDDRTLSAGRHDVSIDGRDDTGEALASGIYLYRIEAAEGSAAGRVALLK